VLRREIHHPARVDHGHPDELGERDELGDGRLVPADAPGDRDGRARVGQPRRELVESAGIGHGCDGGQRAAHHLERDPIHGCHEDLARGHEIDRAARFRRGDLERPWNEVAKRVRPAELVYPLHVAANDARLVAHVLLPVHRTQAAARDVPVDGVGSAAREDDDAGLATHRVVEVAAKVLRPDVHVHDDHLRAARDREVAVRRRERDALEEGGDDPRRRLAPRLERDDGLLERRGVCPGVEEDMVDAERAEELDDRLGPVPRVGRGRTRAGQRLSSPRSAALRRSESSRIFATSKLLTLSFVTPRSAFESANCSTFGYGRAGWILA